MAEEETDFKKRKISARDWKLVEGHVKQEFKRRETDSFRKSHEAIWKEVDRQISMKPMSAVVHQKERAEDWHNVIELGELAKASEIVTADVRRLLFPTTRAWFEPHIEMPPQLNPETGENTPASQDQQKFLDGSLRAFMTQQHIDFGFKGRVELSVKEALHHGSFVAEARKETAMLVYEGTGIESRCAPVWHPHSMWNCYPDPSPSVIGTNMFYTGSMIIREFLPLYQLKLIASKESGWMPANLSKVPKRKNKNKDVDTEDIELIKFYGDITIRREDGDIYLPNSKVVLANDLLVHYAPNDLAFPPILYNGYERMDVRDPYFTSPLIKLAPMHKMASELANKYLDAVALRTEPPTVFDGNDPDFVRNGGPTIAPGWKGATKGLANFKTIEVGDPNYALQGLQLVLDQIRQGTSVDAIRAGASQGVDQTATETRLKQARGEVRVVDFVDKLEFSLRTFLYMQHEINKKSLDNVYSFYNPEMDAPDFMRVSREDLPENVHFEIVGARGVLGEEERAAKMTNVTIMAAQDPMFRSLLNPQALIKEMYQDAGIKNPERFLNIGDESPEVTAVKQQAEQQINEIQQGMQELQAENQSLKNAHDIKAEESQRKLDIEEYKAKREAELKEWIAKTDAKIDAYVADAKASTHEMQVAHKASMDEVKQAQSQQQKPSVQVMYDQTVTDDLKQLSEVATKTTAALESLVNKIEQMAAAAKQPKAVKYGTDGRISEVGGRKVVYENGRLSGLQ